MQEEAPEKGNAPFAVLGVATGEDCYLIAMNEVSEVIPIPKLARVPLTQSWFLGLANVRGSLYGITDLGVYLGGDSRPFNLKSRILLTSSGNKVLSGFIVNIQIACA
jgi:twitching motility protein PilI